MLYSSQTKTSIESILNQIDYQSMFRLHGSFRYQVYKNWKKDLQNYSDLHVLFVWDGVGAYEMSDGISIPLEKGSIVFISQGFNHIAKVDESNPLKIQGLRFGIYDNKNNEITGKLVLPCYFSLKTTNMQYYDHITHKIHQLYHSKGIPMADKLCSSILYQLFSDMYLALMGVSFYKEYDSRIKTAKEYMDKNPFEPATITELAKKGNMSVRYFQKLFKTETGYTPKEYLLRVRMNIAHSYLENESILIKEVASLFGYSDQYIFSRQFHRFFGYPPSKVEQRNF